MLRGLKVSGAILAIIFTLSSLSSFSQSVTGIWRGNFVDDRGNVYKLEFQVKQNSNGEMAVSGVSYSYLDVRFYGKATMTGNFLADSRTFRIREIKTVEVKNESGGGTCIMNYDLKYVKSGKEEFLEGTYLGKPEVHGRPNVYEWGDCGGGKVQLRKVTTSDFYVEPFLRKTETPKSNTKQPATKPPTTRQQQTNPPRTNTTKPKTNKPPVTTTPERNNPTAKTITADTAKRQTPITIPPVKKPILSAPSVIRTRTNELAKSLVVNSRKVIVKIYDNGEIDDDTISVYFDNKPMLINKRLTGNALTVELELDEDGTTHDLIMVAENLGRIPPNTSLMIVEAGSQRFDVRITSTEQKNAMVRFRYKSP